MCRDKLAICSYSLSNNAAGRAITLAQLYENTGYDVEIIGSVFPKFGSEVWEPLEKQTIPKHFFQAKKNYLYILQAFWFVLRHRYSIVHLSKPRFPNIVLGLFYKGIWNSKIIIDIDDEELAFNKKTEIIDVKESLNSGKIPKLKNITDGYWTGFGVGCVKYFDAITVSNPALQKKYGGIIIPHVRDENKFIPSAEKKNMMRRKLGISSDIKVVLFFGTPKRHKGLIETARVLSQIEVEQKVLFLIVGSFQDKSLKDELLSISGVRYKFLENQLYEDVANIVSVGDICVLMQDKDSKVAEYQLPAKLIDALAMGLTVLLSVTPATQFLADDGVVIPVNSKNLLSVLESEIVKEKDDRYMKYLHDYFINNLSIEAYQNTMHDILHKTKNKKFSFYEKINILVSMNVKQVIKKMILALIK